MEAAVRVRNAFHDRGALGRNRLGSPTISIGNLTVGGTGKTPLVIHTARIIARTGAVPVVLTRGYGRPSPRKSILVGPATEFREPARDMGDEAALIRRHIPEAWFGIAKDRFHAGSRIGPSAGTRAFVLDDGFQHRKLHRDLDIVVIDASRPLLSDRMFPRGTLREPVSGLRRCHAVVINGKTGPDADTDRVASEIRALGLTADVFLCEQSIERLVPFEAWARGAHHARLEGPMPPVFLVAALGNPQRFQNDVRKHGARVLGARFFRDHHRLDSDDWEACVRLARGSGARAFVTSEKDAMKISVPPSFPLLVSLQTTRIQGEDAYADLIRRTLEI